MNPEQRQFASALAAQADTHEKWLSIVKFGMQSLLNDQQLFVDIIGLEALCQQKRHDDINTIGQELNDILVELDLRIEMQP